MFVKVFPSMYDGTLATHGPWQALVTFQQFLVLADAQGMVDMTPEAISRRTTIPLEIITVGIGALEQPDPESRSPALDGRRIVRLSDSRSWGWQIVNYASYRAMRDEIGRREYFKQYQRKRRAAQSVNSDVNNVNTLLIDVTKVNPSSKQKKKQEKVARARKGPPISIPKDFSISGRVRRWAAEKGYDRLEQRLDHFIGYAKANGKAYVDWEQAFMNAIRDNWAKLEPAPSSASYVPSKRVAL